MANIALTAAQTFGPTLLKTAGSIALNYAQGAIAAAFTSVREGPRLESLKIQTSRDGAPMPRVFGRARLAGQIIWASQLKEMSVTERQGGKASPRLRNYSYSISFAVGLCEGEIAGIGRIWANGEPLGTAGLTMRVHKGGEGQAPDPLITLIDGTEAPGFRGTAYVVFEDMPLDDFGARLPQLNIEVFRTVRSDAPRLEDLVRGVNLIPSSGEFAYADEVVETRIGPGETRPVNMNNFSGASDFDVAIDQLQDQLPNCDHVMIVVSWFGTDLRCGVCKIYPGAENRDKITEPLQWTVSGIQRQDAYVVSAIDGRPNYGGTPSDESIIQAIKNLKARGIKVSLYPFILMDIPGDNSLPDPYGGAAQSAFPWRGRITCHPAFGEAGTVDKTVAAKTQIDNFFGTAKAGDFSDYETGVNFSGADDFGLRRMILHYAHLAKRAGGVDGFVIGSELRGVTTVRDNFGYPAVDHLAGLAGDVRGILGPQTRLTYAADWTEYFGHHPADGSGDVTFHLDPLWASPAIDAVGIDAYFPLSDWRDGEHLDEALADSIYNIEHLKNNLEDAEGYMFYYASSSDRINQIRTPITDGLGKPWMFRYKDIRNWWGQTHYNRIGGIEQSTPTQWIPESKPIWFTEIGCPAVDKGSNQPNVFYDPKSAESHLPYHSKGQRDDLIQRRYLEAVLEYWSENNTVSSVTGEPMVLTDWTHVWCWDARPFPDFPARISVWSDGPNWRLGHWLSGRMGLANLSEIVSEICIASGLKNFDASTLQGLVSGYVLDRPMSARGALEPLMLAYNFSARETENGLEFFMMGQGEIRNLDPQFCVKILEQPSVKFLRDDVETRPKDVRLSFIDEGYDYQLGAVSARGELSESVAVKDYALPLMLDTAAATRISEGILTRSLAAMNTLQWTSGPDHADWEIGDRVRLPGGTALYIIEQASGSAARQMTARQVPPRSETFVSGADVSGRPAAPWVSKPDLIVIASPLGFKIGVQAVPFSGVELTTEAGESLLFRSSVSAGVTLTELPVRSSVVWDMGTQLDVEWRGEPLFSQTDAQTRQAAAPFAVLAPWGEWEILSAQSQELIGEGTYRLSRLIRGLQGSEIAQSIPAGAQIVRLDSAFLDGVMKNTPLDSQINGVLRAPGRTDSWPVSALYQGLEFRPLSPVHGAYNAASREVSWIRRSRVGGDDWHGVDIPLGEEAELYLVHVYNGDDLMLETTTETPACSVPSGLAAATHINVAQMSYRYGAGRALRITL